jgi:hypothetical protein
LTTIAVKRAVFCCGVATVLAIPGVASAQPTAREQPTATDSSWQLVADQPQPSGIGQLVTVFATSRDNAWVGGTSGYLPFIEHWNGSEWSNVTPTGDVFQTANTRVDGIGASSGTNVWAIVDSGTNGYAVRWNGTDWTKYSFHQYLTDDSIAVESRENVWVFGLGGSGPFARHFNGTRWRAVTLPAVPMASAAVGANDIYAVGPTTASFTNSLGSASDVLMHWNGTSWRSIRLPRLKLTKTELFAPAGIAATRASGVWITGDVRRSTGAEQILHHNLLHWTGKTWRVYSSPVSLGAVAPDGSGGVWMTDFTSGSPESFVHFTAGKFELTTVPVPSSPVPGAAVLMSGIGRIPGTTSVWAVGSFATEGYDAVIYRYGA